MGDYLHEDLYARHFPVQCCAVLFLYSFAANVLSMILDHNYELMLIFLHERILDSH